MAYHPTLGTWIQRDPAGYVDGTSVYQYVRTNPATLTDPFGLKPMPWLNEVGDQGMIYQFLRPDVLAKFGPEWTIYPLTIRATATEVEDNPRVKEGWDKEPKQHKLKVHFTVKGKSKEAQPDEDGEPKRVSDFAEGTFKSHPIWVKGTASFVICNTTTGVKQNVKDLCPFDEPHL